MASGGSTNPEFPKATVGRLSLYLRELETLHQNSQETVSSTQLGQALDITDAQVRKDLAYFGQFGYPGIGYRVSELREKIKVVMGAHRDWNLALVGAGNLGRALLGYHGFRERGFSIVALFDVAPGLIGKKIKGIEVFDMAMLAEIAREMNIQVAILAVPGSEAQSATQAIVHAGINGILNFAPVALKVPEDVCLVSVDLGCQLEQLIYKVNQLNPVDVDKI